MSKTLCELSIQELVSTIRRQPRAAAAGRTEKQHEEVWSEIYCGTLSGNWKILVFVCGNVKEKNSTEVLASSLGLDSVHYVVIPKPAVAETAQNTST